MIEWLGWAATAVFVLSYFCSRPQALRAVQMVGAMMWVVYGVLIGALPVVAANLLVCVAAGWTVARASWADRAIGSSSEEA
jgi:hypothetical protein